MEEVRIGINVGKGLERLFIPGEYAKEIRNEESLKELPELRSVLIAGGYITGVSGWAILGTMMYSLY